MPQNIEWLSAKQGGTPPSPRSGHSMVYIGTAKYLMYGGITAGAQGSKVAPISDIYTLKMTRQDWVWEKQDAQGAEKPAPRAQHVALTVGPQNDKMFVFGGHASPTCRLNDSWILNCKDYTWTRCKDDKTMGDNKASPIGAPSPRANAASCYYQGKVYIYGGHGGLGYSRISLDDVYCFDIETQTWEYLEAVVGLQPLPLGRGGHSIFCADGKLYSYGGWNAEATYNTTICFDLATHEWSDPDIFTEKPRWNHSAVMVEAIPSWKYFIFGGESMYFSEGASRSFGECQDTACFLDLESMKWTTIAPESKECPPVREYSSMVYDADESRLIIFGGWNTGWLNDLYILNVSKVVGPPYAISSIEPEMSQMSGGQPLVIRGVGFIDSNCQVYFTAGEDTPSQPNKNSQFVPGIWVSDTEMHCQSPNFAIHGPKPAVVQLVMMNKDLSTTSCKFSFFLNTRAAKSLCYGTGILSDMQVGEPIEFMIQARNDNNENRISGNDDFSVTIKTKGDEETPAVEIPCEIVDKQDGSYSVIYQVDQPGEVVIKVNFKDETGAMTAVRGQPYGATFIEDAAPKANLMIGPSLHKNCVSGIEQLQSFMKETQSGLNLKEKNLTSVNELLGVKDCVEDCVTKNDQIVLQLDQLQESLKILLANNIGKENQLKQVQKLTDEFTVLKKTAKEVKKEITPLVNTEASKNINYISKLEDDLKAYSAAMKKKDFYKYACGRGPALEKLDGVFDELGSFISKIEELGSNATKFGSPESIEAPEKQVEGIKNEVNAMKQLWDHIAVCQSQFEQNMATGWPSIDPFVMEDQVKKLLSALKNMKVDKRADAYDGLMKEIKKWLVFLPLIGELRNESMRERHWDMIRKLVDSEFQVDENLLLRDIYEMNLAQYAEDVEEVTDQARQEAKMEKTLQKLRETWKDVQFDFQQHKDTEYFTARLGEEDFEMLEEDQTKVTAMLGSRYLATFEEEIQKWNKDLDLVNNVVANLREVQQNWGYLENLFIHSEEVRKELPKESDEFVNIDKDVKMLLKDAKAKQYAIIFSTQAGYLEKIEGANEKLVKCEKALQKFMDDKRTCFPRFYFVATADLLDILSNGNVPSKVMPHLPKIFQAIEDVKLDESTGVRPAALGMKSCVGIEYVPYSEPFKLMGKVEGYMQDIIDNMRKTLRLIAGDSLKRSMAKPRTDWLKEDPSQCMLLVGLTSWVSDVEKGLANNTMPATLQNSIDQLTALIKMVQDVSMPKDLRMKVMCLITMDAHSRDIIGILIDQGVKVPEEFQWQSQMKSYWDPSCDDFALKIADASFYYGYEYLGNGPRLVVTPLTDRIYVTATQALHLSMGCAPSGPAGTGKTETTKDLSSSMGKAIYVFNCSDQMDYLGLANIFKGLAASGSWGCFDEFNRLLPSVLSVCSVQYKCVTDAIKAGVKRFIIQEAEIALDPSNGAYITMNPGYIGRAELPEGLKALFRPITVVVPDLELICQNMLMAEGFVDAIDLARKFRTLYALCNDLLSKAKHYDWGLRAIKSVLVVAGSFKRAEPDMPENAILMRALRDFNLPKIAAEDLGVFNGLLGDLFPGINPIRNRDMDFEGKIVQAAGELKMFPDDDYILKVVQLGELLEIRHCVFTMGPPGCGKSTTWKTLAKANQLNGKKTSVVDINPKVVHPNEFYGLVHIQTREWIDGLFSCKLREYSKETDTNPKWIILDGDLDANWIESMNSVMDDNKLLTLASNERIAVKAHMKLIFEIRNLNFATPATVSRAGILYISDDDGTQWRSYVKSWVKYSSYPQERKEALQALFDKYLDDTYQKMRKFFKNIVPNVVISQVNAICKLLEVMLAEQEVKGLEYIFVFAMVWCMGAGLEIMEGNKSRIAFDKFWRDTWKVIKFPTKGTVFDYYVDVEKSEMKDWNNLRNDAIESQIDTSKAITNYTIPTADTIASQFLMNKFIKINVPPMLVGSAGCGKTQIIKGLLNDLTEKGDAYTSQIINFNFFTDSTLLQKCLETNLEKKGGAGIGPAKGKLIYFVDDLNMPKLDPYDTQTAIALVRQSLDYSHWYDKQKFMCKKILNTQYVAAMNATAGSFIINPRLQRWFWLLAVNFPETNSLNTIYSAFMLKHFAKFKGTISEQVVPVIKSTLELHREVSAKFRKTAANFHYEFNVRHLTNVFQGLLTAKVEAIKEPDHLVKLWVHECERIYGDRLVSPEHLTAYRDIAGDLCKKGFSKYNMTKYFAKPIPEPLVFAQFTESLDDKLYTMFENAEKLNDMCNLALREYNELNAVMPLVLFEDAMKHVCKVTRIISAAQGHALMVGVGGSGKQSLSKLASFICQFSTTGIVISSTYSVNDFKVDLQGMFMKSGVKDEGLMFLFTEGQIKSETYLVFVNDLLSSGEIADLFVQEDIDGIINSVTPAAKSDGVNPIPGPVWRYFIDRVKRNLHMTLCMSPSDEFRARARKFPALINCTVIDWFHPWPQDALLSVARKFLEEVEMASDDERNAVVNFLPYSFGVVQDFSAVVLQAERRVIHTTPKSFLELIKLFKSMLGIKRKDLEDNREKYDRGVIKLQQTQEQIAELEEVLKVTSVTVEEKKKVAGEQAEIVGKEKDKVTIQSDIAGAESIKCAQIAKDVQIMMTNVQKDLDQALPALAAAEKALDGLKVKDFQNLKALNNPPLAVNETFTCVVRLLCSLDPVIPVDKKGRLADPANSWKVVLTLLKQPQKFLDVLKDFKNVIDDKKVPAINFKEIQTTLDNPEFTPEILMTKSESAGGLCDWVKNIAIYYDVFTNVAPKQALAEQAAIDLEEANTKKAVMEAEVAELNAALKVLQDKFQEVMDDKNAAEAEAAKCASKLDMANRLIAALGSESVRWANAIVELDASINQIIGDVLLASAFVSYVGPFNKKFRQKIIEEKFLPFFKTNNIPMSPEADPLLILTSPAQIATWGNQGLPSDSVSVENGSILSASERYSLIIDPQGQGITWLRQKEAHSDMQVTRLTNPKMIKIMEASIEAGKPVMIENLLNSIDAVLQPVYARSIVKKGRNRYLKMGDKELSLHANFNLYLHTKLSNPHYQPEIQAECTLINFTVTEGGLEDQLLDLVVLMERPDLAAQSKELIQMQNNFKITLGELEADLLQRLANSTGDILEDVPLVENLERSKALSIEIAGKVEVAKETQILIKDASEFYRPSASRGALVFFMMNELYMIHSFYRFSLDSFIIVVKRAITIVAQRMAPKKREKAEPVEGEEGEAAAEVEAEPSEEEEEDDGVMSPKTLGIRVDALTDEITYQGFNYTRRGTFDRHKLLLATLLTFRIQIRKGLLDLTEVDALINNSVALDVPSQPENLKMIHESFWPSVVGLQKLKIFSDLIKQMESEALQWRKWYADPNAETCELPRAHKDISLFHRMLLLRAMRPDRLSNALTQFVTDVMGEQFVEQPAFNFMIDYKESTKETPIFFVLFPGEDPTPIVERIGRTCGKTQADRTFTNISMGQGQEKVAEDCLIDSAKNGKWIMIQNVHLMIDWMRGFERKLEVAVAEDCHEDFRCYITSEPPPLPDQDIIPEAILQNSIKIANEAPQNLKANLRRAFSKFEQDQFEKAKEHKEKEYKALLFGLCMFHSLILGRKKFGPQGWSRNYNFNDGDLTICGQVIHNYLARYEKVPYADLRYIFGDIMYGGHITDDWDRRCNSTYLLKLIKPEILQQMQLTMTAGFKSPIPEKFDRDRYEEYIEKSLPAEIPQMFGLHPNAEIGYLTTQANELFSFIQQIQGGSGSSGGEDDGGAFEKIYKFQELCPETFQMLDLFARAGGDRPPFVIVCLQESERMNKLLSEIKLSLSDLDAGLKGTLNITETMEKLAYALSMNQIPPSWLPLAYHSRKGLSIWMEDLILRCAQLERWSEEFETPMVLWLSGLFNPMSFLTAIMQITARATNQPLDEMYLRSDVTNHTDIADFTEYPESGAYVNGFSLEGAGWESGRNGEQGYLCEMVLKELSPEVPTIHVSAIRKKDRPTTGRYACPVYFTTLRGGANFVTAFDIAMESEDTDEKGWILSGVSLFLAPE